MLTSNPDWPAWRRQYALLEFDSFCLQQQDRVRTALDLTERRLRLGPELAQDERSDGSLVFERRQ